MAQNQKCDFVNFSEDYFDFIVEKRQDFEDIMRQFPGACVEDFGLNTAFLHIPTEGTEQGNTKRFLEYVNRFGYMAIPKLFGLMDTSNVEAIGATRIQNQPVLNLRGQGVMLGFVDTGIAYNLPIFQNEDGTSRILGIWDQNIENGNTYEESSPFKKGYGTYYNQEEITEALQQSNPYDLVPSRDEEGHGTFMAGIAAGKYDKKADFIGVAPDTAIAVVKLKPAKRYLRRFFGVPEGIPAYSELDIMNGVQFLLDLSVYYKKPIIICIGVGTNQGGHDGRMPISRYLSGVSDTQSMAVVQAAGNEGNARRHYYGRVSEEMQDTVEIRVGRGVEEFTVELWGNSLNTFYVGLQSPGGQTIEPVFSQNEEVRKYDFILEGSTVYIQDRIMKMQGGDNLILLHFVAPSEGIWKIQVAVRGAFQANFHMWMPISQFVSEDTYFLASNPYTTLVSNACATNTIVTGMYNHYLNALVPESSKGYTRINQVKPDVTAPGVNVYGPATDGTYTMRTGSSIAAAHGAGAAALIMEFGVIRGYSTYMDGLEIKTLMIRGAERKPTLEYPNPDWGYGTLNVYQVFQEITGQR